MTKPEDRKKYVDNLNKALMSDGHALMATFGPNGPLKCSGLEIVRYSAENLQEKMGQSLKLEKHFIEIHKIPFDTTQEFLLLSF